MELYYSIDEFCKAEVEPMYKECEHVQVTALTEYLGIHTSIAYLDGRSFDAESGISMVNFCEDMTASRGSNLIIVNLLYRPGHYDILYKE